MFGVWIATHYKTFKARESRMLFQLSRDVRIGRPLENLAVNGVSDDCLIFPRQIFV
jgi:hypothetical protein